MTSKPSVGFRRLLMNCLCTNICGLWSPPYALQRFNIYTRVLTASAVLMMKHMEYSRAEEEVHSGCAGFQL